jgi:Rrf2 family protein
MLLSRQAGYAIEAVLQLARANTSRPLSSGELAAAGNMPVRYLLAILRKLVRGGILRSRRGASGGYVLAKAASAISLLDLIEGVDGPITQIWIRPQSVGQRNGNRPNAEVGSVQAFAASFAAVAENGLELELAPADTPDYRCDGGHCFGAGEADREEMSQRRQSKASARAFGEITTAARDFLSSLKISELAGISSHCNDTRPHDMRSMDILDLGVASHEWAGGNWVI